MKPNETEGHGLLLSTVFTLHGEKLEYFLIKFFL